MIVSETCSAGASTCFLCLCSLWICSPFLSIFSSSLSCSLCSSFLSWSDTLSSSCLASSSCSLPTKTKLRTGDAKAEALDLAAPLTGSWVAAHPLAPGAAPTGPPRWLAKGRRPNAPDRLARGRLSRTCSAGTASAATEPIGCSLGPSGWCSPTASQGERSTS